MEQRSDIPTACTVIHNEGHFFRIGLHSNSRQFIQGRVYRDHHYVFSRLGVPDASQALPCKTHSKCFQQVISLECRSPGSSLRQMILLSQCMSSTFRDDQKME